MNSFVKFPFYAKASLIFIGLFAFVGMLFITQRIIVPLIYSVIISIVLSPVVDFLYKKGMSRVLAITVTVLFIIFIALSIVALLYSQASTLVEAFPKLINKFDAFMDRFVIWSSGNFNIDRERVNSLLRDAKQSIIDGRMALIGQTLLSAGSLLVVLLLIPVYIFMILYYKPLLLEFIHRLFSFGKYSEVDEVLNSTKRLIQSYLVGLLLEAVIIATLQTTTLLILGIDYAVLFGVIGALCNIIPYIGGIIGVSFPVIITLLTKQSLSYPLLIIGAYLVIQFTDNHYIMPKVVGSKVKLNALVSIIVVLIGGALWGIPGMFLSIPLTAILKTIFDHIESLKPWGFLLGDRMPGITRENFHIKEKNVKINATTN